MKHSSSLIKQGSIMFFAVALFNIFNLLYQLFMVRNLSTVDYGILNSLLSIFVIVSIPSGTLQTVMTKYISIFHTIDHHEKINTLIYSFIRKTLVFGIVLFLILFLGRDHISSFIQISSPFFIVILGLTTLLTIILPIAQGGLQGLQMFGYLGLAMITNGFTKFILGVLFIRIGYGVMGAMSALAVSVFITLILAFIMLISVLPKTSVASSNNSLKSEIDFSEVHRYFYSVTTVYLCFMILTNLDVVLVKHFFEPLEAGYYSISQMVGKIILFLPIAVTLVMFPRTSSLHAKTQNTLSILTQSIVLVGILSGTAALICFFFPSAIIKLLSGRESLECIPLARRFSVTMFFYALVYVLLFYHLSIHNLKFIHPLILLTGLEVIAIILFHRTLSQVVDIMCGNAILLFAVNAYLAFKSEKMVAGVDSDINSY